MPHEIEHTNGTLTTIEYQPGDPEYEGPYLFCGRELFISVNSRVACHKHNTIPEVFVDRHYRGDLGEYVDVAELQHNEESIKLRRPVRSQYYLGENDWLLVITDAEREATRVTRDTERAFPRLREFEQQDYINFFDPAIGRE